MDKPDPIWLSWTPDRGYDEYKTMEEAAWALAESLEPDDNEEWYPETERSCVFVAFKVLKVSKDTAPPRDGHKEACQYFTVLSDELVKSSSYPVPQPPAHEPRRVYYRDERGEVHPCVVVYTFSFASGERAVIVDVTTLKTTSVPIDRIFHNKE